MCVKIVHPELTFEFDVESPLDKQVYGATEIRVNYDPNDLHKLDTFLSQLEKMVRLGINCEAEIVVEPGNSLEGLKLERHLEKLKYGLEVNEIAKGLTRMHNNTDHALCEISGMCKKVTNE